ncbi:trna-dihydrouridine synthase 3 [Lasallia pustulata]|uniref:Trna-dihydrouridine synthase 3 n=1 Tax=Lasallia pustulata TaxID=136370 RepID=A0A1W5D0M9_9LECA|nr:trna-dihydrouridine synthase 3 [Lasallia pustulata]
MLARGALIKPWLFEEIASGQYLDKSATERLAMVDQYVRFGLETWGADEMGVGTTRRFLLVGLLEVLTQWLQDRPSAWRGRNELESLLGSGDFRDWIKISEMFLGPAHKDFRFAPKHKSNSYEIEAEG